MRKNCRIIKKKRTWGLGTPVHKTLLTMMFDSTLYKLHSFFPIRASFSWEFSNSGMRHHCFVCSTIFDDFRIQRMAVLLYEIENLHRPHKSFQHFIRSLYIYTVFYHFNSLGSSKFRKFHSENQSQFDHWAQLFQDKSYILHIINCNEKTNYSIHIN